MLRVSEFTNQLVSVHDVAKEACRGDITFEGPAHGPTRIQVLVKCSKTDNFRTGQTLHVYKCRTVVRLINSFVWLGTGWGEIFTKYVFLHVKGRGSCGYACFYLLAICREDHHSKCSERHQ